MKKIVTTIVIAISAFTTITYAQIGINTKDPAATFDIAAKNMTGKSNNVDGLLIPRVDRERAQNMNQIPTSTLIFINSISTGTQSGLTANVDAIGYYFFDGSIWTKLNPTTLPAASVNIYNADGSLTGNRTVTQGTNTLTFNPTATNGFSVDGNTFSVDAANDRIGIGTIAPENKFQVVTTASTANRFSLIDAPTGSSQHSIIALRNTSPQATGNFALLGFTNSGTTSGGANWGIGSLRTATGEDFFFGNSLGSSYLERMRITSDGNVGIGTATPDSNALLDLSSSSKGFLPPRLTTAQRNAIASKPGGLMIYNTDLNCMQYWNTAAWVGDCSAGPAGGNVVTLNCAGATNNGTLTSGTSASGVSSVISYTGGNGGTFAAQNVSSTGVTGLTATLNAGNFNNGNGTLTYTITGTPTSSGTASFAINIGGQACTLTRTVNVGAGAITSIDCAGATNNGTLTSGSAASGVSSTISYTGGNGGAFAAQNVSSTGVTGLTATLNAGSFATGNGSLTYTITGTPSAAGTASFAINIGGQACTLTRTVGSVTPPNPDLTSTCTGFSLPFIQTNASATGTVNGVSVTATSTLKVLANTSGPTTNSCGVVAGTYKFSPQGNGTQPTLAFKFNRLVSNIKVFQASTINGGTISYTLRRNGVAVTPTLTFVNGGVCDRRFRITNNQILNFSNINDSGVIYNVGGVWFDEIELTQTTSLTSNGEDGNTKFEFCVGSAQ